MNREEWNERYAAAPRLFTVEPGPFLGQELAGISPGRALDLGAGEGRNAIWLARNGWTVTAVDFADVALERGRRLADEAGVGERITWAEADVTDYLPEESAYDLVLVMFMHPPADRRRALLARWQRALRPGGMLLVAGYDSANAEHGEDGVRDPAILFRPDDIVAGLDGMRIERAETIQVGKAYDAIVRAVKDGA